MASRGDPPNASRSGQQVGRRGVKPYYSSVMSLDPISARAAACHGSRTVCTLVVTAVLSLLLMPARGSGQYVLEDVKDKERYGPSHLILPYAFYTPSDRFGGGFIWQSSGNIQPQTDSFVLAFGNLNNTYGIEGGTDDLQIKPIDRLFVSTQFGIYRYNYSKIYISGNPFFHHHPAGTNHSSDDNFISRRHNDDWGHVEFKYLLPVGGGRDTIVNRYTMEEGLIHAGATGGWGWNPLNTGRTYLTLTPFFEYQTIEDPTRDIHINENGLRFGVVYDNTDFPLNPSSGNLTRLILSRDFGVFDTSNPWTNVSAEYIQYLNLGRSRWFRQQVLAGDLWTSYSLTWSETVVNGTRTIYDGPPFYDGATLGGSTRFRGFFENRFWDRAAIYGSLELRVIPDWNPFAKIGFLKPADLTWMQWVVFVEGGRVAPVYSPNIFSHLKADAGFGIRILANDTLVRFDVAASNETFGVWAGLSQPF